jgi:hypothetical protein
MAFSNLFSIDLNSTIFAECADPQLDHRQDEDYYHFFEIFSILFNILSSCINLRQRFLMVQLNKRKILKDWMSLVSIEVLKLNCPCFEERVLLTPIQTRLKSIKWLIGSRMLAWRLYLSEISHPQLNII